MMDYHGLCPLQFLDEVLNSIDPHVYDYVSISYPRQLMEYAIPKRASRRVGWNSMRFVSETSMKDYLGEIHVSSAPMQLEQAGAMLMIELSQWHV